MWIVHSWWQNNEIECFDIWNFRRDVLWSMKCDEIRECVAVRLWMYNVHLCICGCRRMLEIRITRSKWNITIFLHSMIRFISFVIEEYRRKTDPFASFVFIIVQNFQLTLFSDKITFYTANSKLSINSPSAVTAAHSVQRTSNLTCHRCLCILFYLLFVFILLRTYSIGSDALNCNNKTGDGEMERRGRERGRSIVYNMQFLRHFIECVDWHSKQETIIECQKCENGSFCIHLRRLLLFEFSFIVFFFCFSLLLLLLF